MSDDFEGETFFEHVWTAGYDRVLSASEIGALTLCGVEAVRNVFDAIKDRKVPAEKTVRVTIKIATVDPDPEFHRDTEIGRPR